LTILSGAIGANGSVVLPFTFDHVKPDYNAVLRWRADFLHEIRRTDSAEKLKAFYRTHPGQFIADWGVIFEPRNVEIGLPSKIPFVFFPRQVDWLDWTLERWRSRQRGVTIKSRGSGVSWLAISLAATLCLFNDGITAGFGSRKSELVDQLGDPKSLFFKARMFLSNLPPEFRCGWQEKEHAREMRVSFPATESVMTGESGDQIGRGDRTSLYFVDEAGFLEHPELAEGSLADTTNCRIDISTAPSDSTSPFWDRVDMLPPEQVFTFSWRDDPRRTPEWEAKMRREYAPAVFAREFDMSRDTTGAFFTDRDLLVRDDSHLDLPEDERPYIAVPTPRFIDAVFAVIDTAVKDGLEHDGLAVTYFGLSLHGTTPFKLYVLDWDYTQIAADLLIKWLPEVFKHATALATECHARAGSAGAWIEDKAAGMVLLQQADRAGWLAREGQQNPPKFSGPGYIARAINSKLTSLGKTERATNASGPVARGEVKFTVRAFNKTVDFKGIVKNHQWLQVLGFRMGVKDKTPKDLLDTFCYGVAIGLGNPKGF
jgi:hypothetical protein